MKYDIMPLGGPLEGYTSEVTGLLMTSSGFSGSHGKLYLSVSSLQPYFLFFVIYSNIVFFFSC